MEHKTQHYEIECSQGGPLHHARRIPLIVDAGGRLGEEANALLRSWARLAAAGNDLKCENISDQASSILRQPRAGARGGRISAAARACNGVTGPRVPETISTSSLCYSNRSYV